MDVFEFAMKMEVDGKEYYEKLTAETLIEGLRNIFTVLAGDEQKHYEAIERMQRNAPGTMADSTALENAKNIFNDLMATKDSLEPMNEDIDGYRHAMTIESDSERFYRDAAAKEGREQVRTLLLRIAAEERKHFEIVQNIYDIVLRPKYFLAWREFSNLDEL